jgi:peptidyl-prolyl cis-trans isomerase B (cyclophilin B)
MNQQQHDPRRVRRQRTGVTRADYTKLDLPGPLRWISNPKLFLAFGLLVGGIMVLSLASGVLFGNTTSTGETGRVQQANEAPDAPPDQATAEGTPAAAPTAAPVAKRYTVAPAAAIDTSKRYLATIKTPKGDIQMELYPDAAPEAVNAFVFLAKDGYYNGTPFMELAKGPDGSRFYAQAGDPTRTGLGTPGFSVRKEQTNRPFTKGAVGMGGTAENSNGGQFFISYGDYPTLNGKYTIFGQVVSGMDVLDKLALLDLTQRGGTTSPGDEIQAVAITER